MKGTKIFLKKKKNKKHQCAHEQHRKEKKRQYGRERYKNLLDDEKQRLVKYIKN